MLLFYEIEDYICFIKCPVLNIKVCTILQAFNKYVLNDQTDNQTSEQTIAWRVNDKVRAKKLLQGLEYLIVIVIMVKLLIMIVKAMVLMKRM